MTLLAKNTNPFRVISRRLLRNFALHNFRVISRTFSRDFAPSLRGRGGQALLEVILAIGVIALLAITIATAVTVAFRAQHAAKLRGTAAALAAEGMEAMRQIAYSDDSQSQGWNRIYCPPDGVCPSGQFPVTAGKGPSNFYDAYLSQNPSQWRLVTIPPLASFDTWDKTFASEKLRNGTGAPPGRYLHTVVWTGNTGNPATANKMVVWGGYGLLGYLNTGGIYNPATDIWELTAVTGAPAGRDYHTAVWTGNTGNPATANKMVVWGGLDGTFLPIKNNGGIYDPATPDTWDDTLASEKLRNGTGAPTGRFAHTAVWTGNTGNPATANKMVVWGGYDGTSFSRKGGIYDPATGAWDDGLASENLRNGTGAPPGRNLHTAVWTGNTGNPATANKMVVWGGYDGISLKTGGVYNPATDIWELTAVTDAPTGRRLHTAVWTGTKMVVWGGYDGTPTSLKTGGIYDPDPATNTWEPTAITDAPTGRYSHTAVWTGNTGNPATANKMVAWGGYGCKNPTCSLLGYLNTGGIYNPAIDTWESKPNLNAGTDAPSGRYSHTAVWTGTKMVVWGGLDGSYSKTGGAYVPGTSFFLGGVVYTRLITIENVCRQGGVGTGNITGTWQTDPREKPLGECDIGSYDDPWTQKVTVTVKATGIKDIVVSQYLTRSRNVASTQASFIRGATTPILKTELAFDNTYYNADSSITTASGSITLNSGQAAGQLTSSVFDTRAQNGAALNSILWRGAIGTGKVRLQVASSNCANGANDPPACTGGSWDDVAGPGADFLGVAGSSDIVNAFEPASGVPAQICPSGENPSTLRCPHYNKRYFRYKVMLCSATDCTSVGAYSPVVNQISINWAR